MTPMEPSRAYIVEVEGPGEPPDDVAAEGRLAWLDREMQRIKVGVRTGIEALRVVDPSIEVIDSAPLLPTLVLLASDDVIERVSALVGVRRVYADYEVDLAAG